MAESTDTINYRCVECGFGMTRHMACPRCASARYAGEKSWTEKQFETWAGRMQLDDRFGVGFGTSPRGVFEQGKDIPLAEDIRARVAAAIVETSALKEIRRLAHDDPFAGLMFFAIDGERVTPLQFLQTLKGGATEVPNDDRLSLYRELSERGIRQEAKR